jgi:hypothetical protein
MPPRRRPRPEWVPPARAEEVRRVLWAWRKERGWQRGMVWNPYRARYERPGGDREHLR